MWTQSFTPASSTLWLPTGRPALVSLSTARETSGVISFGWLKCRLIHSGWYFCSISHSSSSMRCGRNTGTREPIRMISMCGISRRPRRIFSNSFGARVRPSPPEMRTSRTCGVRRRYSSWASWSRLLKFWVGSPTIRDRVQYRQYDAHWVVTSMRTRSG